jgi:hypothetical protein
LTKNPEQFSEEETARGRDEVIRRMANTPAAAQAASASQLLSLSSLKIWELAPIDSKPVSA